MPDTRVQARYEELEARVARLDELTADATTSDDVAAVSAKRRFLHVDLAAEGLFDDSLPAESGRILSNLALLHGYRDAALRLRSYLASSTRTEFIKTDPPRLLTAARISLDWFRFPQPVPNGFNEDEWLAYCEFMMSSVQLGSSGGEILFKVHGKLCTLRWRFEDGIHPALFKVTF